MEEKPSNNNGENLSWGSETLSLSIVDLFALLIRVLVSLHPYSGSKDPPKFGDFEVQRHWMEITLHTPITDWYRNTTYNDFTYWGLDYPPLTAYQSYFHGLFLHYFHPKSTEIFTSRGHESPFGKILMRWTVLSSDILVFFPVAVYFVVIYYGSRRGKNRKEDMVWWCGTLP